MRKKIEVNIKEDELKEAVINSVCFQDLFKHFNLAGSGHHYRILHRLIKKFDISNSHFTGSGWNRGRHVKCGQVLSLDTILVENSTYTSTNRLRKRLIHENIFEARCCNCKLTEWMGRKIPLELEHKNGIKNDHRKENLELRCPNCHALTRFYRGRNMKSAREKVVSNMNEDKLTQ
ncbi:MAG: hypothetical protein Q7R33_07990 [Nitrosarchaeum sp.]|nr:hypothetical protein [Nitrosarchaeum sp.]